MCLDQQTGQAERDAVVIVGRTTFLPEYPGDHPEHRSAIKPEPAVCHRINVKLSKFHRVCPFCLEERVVRLQEDWRILYAGLLCYLLAN